MRLLDEVRKFNSVENVAATINVLNEPLVFSLSRYPTITRKKPPKITVLVSNAGNVSKFRIFGYKVLDLSEVISKNSEEGNSPLGNVYGKTQ